MLIRLCTFLCVVILIGCSPISKDAILGGSGRNAYNFLIHETNNEQMLLNLVRLRYNDFPFFLDVSTVTSQFSESAKATSIFPIPGFNSTNPMTLGGEVSWYSTPTIQYSPVEGAAFIQHLMKPIDLLVIQQLIYSGWDVDRVFRMSIQNIDDLNNARNGPVPRKPPKYKNFYEMVELLRYFQELEELQIGVRLADKDKRDESPFLGTGLQISVPNNDPNTPALKRYLPEGQVLQDRYTVEFDMNFGTDSVVGVMPRSVLDSMYYLCYGVNVPVEHIQKNWVSEVRKDNGTIFDWKKVLQGLMDIKSSKKKPKEAFVKIQYRGYWYYIAESDVESKRTFTLLLQLYSLQSVDEKAVGPLLTLPVY